MLIFKGRYKVEKDEGHLIWYDILEDDETGVEYFHINGNLTPRVKA